MMEQYKDCKQALKEVNVILNNTSLNDVSKIDVPFIKFIESNADENYTPNINFNQPLQKQKLMPETIDILSLIYLKYWCDTQAKKEEYNEILNKNEEEYQAVLALENNSKNFYDQNKQIQLHNTNFNKTSNTTNGTTTIKSVNMTNATTTINSANTTNTINSTNKTNTTNTTNSTNTTMPKNVSVVVVKNRNIFRKMLNWIKSHI